MKRRSFLRGAAATTALVAGGGIWRAYDQGVFSAGEGPAFTPWEDWRGEPGEGPLALVRAGLLAASPHNTQPWLWKVTENRIELYADTSRNLGAFDPFLREMHIGLGCAIENVMTAALHLGTRTALTLPPGRLGAKFDPGRPPLVARIDLTPGGPSPQRAYDYLPRRHTNRGPYDPDRTLDAAYLLKMRKMIPRRTESPVVHFSDGSEGEELGQLIVETTEAIIADKEMMRDSDRWFRHRWCDVQKSRDGVTLDAAGLTPFMTAAAKMLPAPSPQMGHDYWLRATREVQVPMTPLFGVIAVPDLYDRVQALQVGRLWQLYQTWNTMKGVATQPINQPLELIDRLRARGEKPEYPPALAHLMGSRSLYPTFIFRMGHALREAAPSPRRSLGQVLLKH